MLIVIPGPGVLFVVGRALAHGRRTALATACGHAAGNYVVAACVAVGLGADLAAFGHGVRGGQDRRGRLPGVARHPRDTAPQVAGRLPSPWRRSRGSGWRALRDGVVVGITNPKSYILFGAILPCLGCSAERSGSGAPDALRSRAEAGAERLAVACCTFRQPVSRLTQRRVTYLRPASPVGTWFASSPRLAQLRRRSGGGVRRAGPVDPDAAQRQHGDQHRRAGDRRVGQVERPGKCGRLIQSTTRPRSGPGARNSRSPGCPSPRRAAARARSSRPGCAVAGQCG